MAMGGRGSPSGLVPQTNNSSLGLGATGGPRGFAAGVTQILANFIINYDRGRLAQLTQDIKKFEADRTAAGARFAAISQRQTQLEKQVTAAQNARQQIGKQGQATLNAIATTQQRINSLTQLATKNQQAHGVALTNEKAIRDRLIQGMAATTGLSERQIRAASNLDSLERQLLNTQNSRKATAAQILSLENQITNAKRAQGQIQGAGAGAAGRLGSLGIGLIGGTIGGALVSGAILGPLMGGLNALTDLAQDIIDPARKAREVVDDLGNAINGMIDDDTPTRLDAARRKLEELAPALRGLIDPNDLANAARLAALQKENELLSQIITLLGNQDVIEAQINQTRARGLVQLATQKGDLKTISEEQFLVSQGAQEMEPGIIKAIEAGDGFKGVLADWDHYLGSAVSQTDQVTTNTQDASAAAAQAAANFQAAADAARELNQELAQAAVEAASVALIDTLESNLRQSITNINAYAEADIDGIRQRAENAADGVSRRAKSRIDALQDRMGDLEVQPSGRTRGLEGRLDALKDSGPSRRTKELADQIERLGLAQEKATYKQSLADVAEQRHQILLRERLRLTKQEIDLNDYKGKDRLIAIDALLSRMQKQNEAQDRFNKLLDIQYQIQQGVRRQQGETIDEFVSRRAQYYRGLLQQAGELNRAGAQAELEAEKERVEASVGLKELEEKRRKLIEDRARQLYLRSLQEQLQASQDRDRKELESRRESLQKQLEASRKADQAALESRREALQKIIERVRDTAAAEIEAINDTRDRSIEARQKALAASIATVEAATARAIAAEEKRAAQIKAWASYAESQRLITAFDGAQDMATLQRYAGAIAGAGFSEAYLQAQLNALGVPFWEQQTILANVRQLLNAYQRRMGELRPENFHSPSMGGYAEGGFIRLNNSNTPLNGDVRWGDAQGDEYGMMILNNKIVSAIRENGGAGGSPLVGGDVIFQSQDPYRDAYRFRRLARDVQRSEFN